MHLALFFESFSFCSRDDLESVQLVSQSLLDTIVDGSGVLPLRPIYRVSMVCSKAKIGSPLEYKASNYALMFLERAMPFVSMHLSAPF